MFEIFRTVSASSCLHKYEDTYGTFMDDRFVQTCEGEGETLYEGKCLQHSHYISSVVNCSDVPEQYCNPHLEF